MQYASWTNNKKFQEKLFKYDMKGGIKQSGLPLMYDDNYMYINEHEGHNLVIGSTGSGKTQTVILPMARLSIKSGESFVIVDNKMHAYEVLKGMLEDEGYNVIAIDFNEAKLGNNWNPLTLSYDLYKDSQIDLAIKELEKVAYYLFSDPKTPNDFWINSAIDYFTGLALYLYDNAVKDTITIENVYMLGNVIDNNPIEFLNKLNNNSTTYYSLLGTLKSPKETRGGIIATFNKELKKYVSRVNLSNMLSKSDFNFNDITNSKTAIFIISGNNSDYDNIIPLLINQIIDSISSNNKKRFNILLDGFNFLLPIKDFSKIINNCRSNKICITAIIRSFRDLINTYGKEDTEILKMCFTNIIYLLSNDYETLEEVSKMCGNTLNNKEVEPLITVEELKTLNYFEAIVLMIRENPIRTKMLPDFKIDWNVKSKGKDLKSRKTNEIKLFNIQNI